jgi:hypothetical protein
MFGAIKGEMQSSNFEKIKKAATFAKEIVSKAIDEKQDTDWVEKMLLK